MEKREKNTHYFLPPPPPPAPWPWDRAPRGKHLTCLLIPETTDRSRHSDGDADCRLCAVRGGWERVGCGLFSAGAVGLGRGWGRGGEGGCGIDRLGCCNSRLCYLLYSFIFINYLPYSFILNNYLLYSFIFIYHLLYSFICIYNLLYSLIFLFYLLYSFIFNDSLISSIPYHYFHLSPSTHLR